MYNTIVPVNAECFLRSDKDKLAGQLKSAGASMVLVALGGNQLDAEKCRKKIAECRECISFLKERGFEVGVWIWTLWWHGENKEGFTHLRDFDKKEVDGFCPLDERYVEFAGKYMQDLAAINPDIILLDDDFRFGYWGRGVCCVCEHHIKDISRRLGEDVEPNDLIQKVFTGGKNKYRTAFMQSMGDSLRSYARAMRKYVDEVNPAVRIGHCSCITNWDGDGVPSDELAKLFAGGTKPYLRLIGAPYWWACRAYGQTVASCIELHRMELSYCKNFDGEIVSEGDPWPRPRYKCPAAFLEIFDVALIAEKGMTGIQKYMCDYFSTERYELGYLNKHNKNADLRKAVRSIFMDKTSVGLRVYEHQYKLENFDLMSDEIEADKVSSMMFSPAAKMLSSLSVATTYEGASYAGIAFGENAKYISENERKNGLILDAVGAVIMQQRGVDVGLCGEAAGKNLTLLHKDKVYVNATIERFVNSGECVRAEGQMVLPLPLRVGACVESVFVDDEGNETPASYVYENAAGERYFVFLTDAYDMQANFYRNYMRQQQIVSAAEWMSRKKFPAVCLGNPDLYVRCSEKEGKYAVLLCNIFEDSIDVPVLKCASNVKDLKVFSGEGKIEGDKIVLSELKAFESMAVEFSLEE